MYSVAPLVVRKALQDVRIGQYTIPAGTAMILHMFAMHNTSANFERHIEFLPVRPFGRYCQKSVDPSAYQDYTCPALHGRHVAFTYV